MNTVKLVLILLTLTGCATNPSVNAMTNRQMSFDVDHIPERSILPGLPGLQTLLLKSPQQHIEPVLAMSGVVLSNYSGYLRAAVRMSILQIRN